MLQHSGYMGKLSPDDVAVLALRSRMGDTLDEALSELPLPIARKAAKRILDREGIKFRRTKQALRPGQWIASACRKYQVDDMDARQSNRERARLRYRVSTMGMSLHAALEAPAMTPSEKGKLGAYKRWGRPIVVEANRQLMWQWL